MRKLKLNCGYESPPRGTTHPLAVGQAQAQGQGEARQGPLLLWGERRGVWVGGRAEGAMPNFDPSRAEFEWEEG